MSVEIITAKSETSRPIWFISKNGLDAADLPASVTNWAKAHDFNGQEGQILVVPSADGSIGGALIGTGLSAESQNTGKQKTNGQDRLLAGYLGRNLPAGDWHIASALDDAALAILAILMGSYSFNKYRNNTDKAARRFVLPEDVNFEEVQNINNAVTLVRDLINTPTNDMGPENLEQAVRDLGAKHNANVSAIIGEELLQQNFPMIHAVGRAGSQAPRLIDLQWGDQSAPKVTLVGKGVCFDTGGLDIKSASNMLLMKKDMGGAANVIGLASMIMDANLPIRLRVLIPAVENSISSNAFRPSDVLTSRKGLTVEVGNTDAEGRLVLADALALADEEEPEILIDMATLTGAARVALGPELPPYFSHCDDFAAEIADAADKVADPVWRMPLWQPYDKRLTSRIADINNVTTDGFAGAVTAALFLNRFVSKAKNWSHFDIYGWVPVERAASPVGGEAQAIRALYQLLKTRFTKN